MYQRPLLHTIQVLLQLNQLGHLTIQYIEDAIQQVKNSVRESSSSTSEEQWQSQRQSVSRDSRRGSSSSSTEDNDPRQGRSRRRSPAPPKLPTFTGEDVSLKWPSFVFQFERTATRYNWSKSKKADRLLDCLGGKALEFVWELQLECDYMVLTRKLGRRFDIRDAPSTVRRELQFSCQEAQESLEEYSQQIHFLIMEGYPGAAEKTLEQIALEHFFRGCLD